MGGGVVDVHALLKMNEELGLYVPAERLRNFNF